MIHILTENNSVEAELKIMSTKDMNIEATSNLVSLSYDSFLEANKEKTIKLKAHLNPGVHTGKIIIANEIEKKIPIIIEVRSGHILAKIDIPKRIKADSDMPVTLTIVNMNETIEVNYMIKDFDNNIILSKKENLTPRNLSTKKILHIPAFLKKDDYVVALELVSDDKVSTTAQTFYVTEDGRENLFNITILIIIVVAVFFLLDYRKLTILEKRYLKRSKEVYAKYIKRKESKRATKKKLEKQLEILQNAYKTGSLTKRTYLRCKRKIEKMLQNVKKKA